MKKMTLFAIGALIALASCNKDGDDTPINNNPDDFKDMVVQDNFNWRTSDEVTLNEEGLPTDYPASATLKVKRITGTEIYKRFTGIDESFSIELTIPETESQVIVQFNTIVDTVDIATANFSFIPKPLPGDE